VPRNSLGLHMILYGANSLDGILLLLARVLLRICAHYRITHEFRASIFALQMFLIIRLPLFDRVEKELLLHTVFRKHNGLKVITEAIFVRFSAATGLQNHRGHL